MTTQRLNPVAWIEGLFLRPHHLQQHELFNEERLRYHLRALNPFHWGVRTLEVDEEALSDHSFSILQLDAVLPGGIIVSHPGNAVIEKREFDPASQRIEVHLGIHQLSSTEANAARHGESARDVRFMIHSHDLPDVASGGAVAPIELAHPNLRVLLSGEESVIEQHETFKVAEIVATGELKRPFALSPTYAPPLLAIQGHGPLFDEVTRLISQMAASLRVVAGRTVTIAVGDLDKVFMRYELARMTPVLRHLISTGETRPFDLYSALVETAGGLATFQQLEAVELPRYDHQDLYRCFHELMEFINIQLKAEGFRFREIKLEFDPETQAYSTSALNTDLVDPRNLYYLAIKADMDSQGLRELVVQHGKASSTEGVTFLVEFNVFGLRIEHLQAAPTEIAGPPGFEYFKLDPHGDHWSKVRNQFTFALNLGKLESADARLYIVTPPGG